MAALQIHHSHPLEYIVRTPDVASADPPILCFLHGYDEAAPTSIRTALTRHGPLHPAAAAIARESFVIVAPQLRVAGDLWHRHADDVISIVESVRRSVSQREARVYLSGFSFGGNGVFDLALHRPDFWSALWSVDPTRVPPDAGIPVWLSVGEIARRRTATFVSALSLTPPAASSDRVILDEGEDHVGSARRAYADEQIYRWLLSKSKK